MGSNDKGRTIDLLENLLEALNEINEMLDDWGSQLNDSQEELEKAA